MKIEIKQFSETVLWAQINDELSIKMIFRNITGRNFSGKDYRDYVKRVILTSGFALGKVELWRNGTLVEVGHITLGNNE